MLDFRPHFSVIYDAGNDESIPAKKNEDVNRDSSYRTNAKYEILYTMMMSK